MNNDVMNISPMNERDGDKPRGRPQQNSGTTTFAVNAVGKNIIIAYLLWFFLGFGVHRLYLGRLATGFTQMALFGLGMITAWFGIGFIFLMIFGVWWLLDVYFTQAIVAEENAKRGISTNTGFTYTSTSASQGSSSNKAKLEELEKLFELKEKGIITEEEYQARRKDLI